MSSVRITAFYKFLPLEQNSLAALREDLVSFGAERGMRGLVLLAPEGINGTVCGPESAIGEWKALLAGRFGEMVFKDSAAAKPVFSRLSIKLKPEIVALKRPDVLPSASRHKHLSPAEWHKMLASGEAVVLDTRNDYEVALGKFKGAIDPGTVSFHEFPDAVKKAGIPKDKKVMMYCTGGIRCEKAILAMEEQGYENVYQLEGGILAYLAQFPEGAFEGECFVFDQRTAVDARLNPSNRYHTCPHCGLPGDRPIECSECGTYMTICAPCAKHEHRLTCSKRCANERLMEHAKNEAAV